MRVALSGVEGARYLRASVLPLRPVAGGSRLAARYEERARTAKDRVRGTLVSRSLTQNVLDLLAFTTSEKERIAGAARHEGEFRLATGETVRIRFSSYEHAFTDEEREGLTIARAALDKALGQTRAAGAHFLAVHVPTKLAVYRDLCRFGDDAPPSTWEVPATGPWLAAWCRENEVAFLDLQTALDEAAARGELTYYVADLHWNARGNDVAARAIADRLTATGWLTD